MKNIPLVSIIMPLYNKRPYVRRALESVQQQTFTNWELIVVDDGSTDGGADIVKGINDNRIQVIHQENKGPGAARNAGLAIARGKYVAFLDADDEYLPLFLEKGIILLEDKTANVTMVFTDFYYYPDMRRYMIFEEGVNSSVIEISPKTDLKLIRKLCSHWTCAAIMKTDIVRKWGGFFDKYKCLYGEDGFLFIKLVFNERISIVPEPLVIYHTEASDLYGGSTINKCFPVAPYLEYPEEIVNACPSMKADVLKRMLAQIAFNKAKSLAKWGKKKDAQELINRFDQNDYPTPENSFKVRLLVNLAPVLPIVRWFWRSIKSINRKIKALYFKFYLIFRKNPCLSEINRAGRNE
ncbi:MAG: glycosyltransferase family 2 protein [Thermodesulfovibrionales bacterium]